MLSPGLVSSLDLVRFHSSFAFCLALELKQPELL